MIGDHLGDPGAARQSEEGVHLAAILAPRNGAAGRERAKPIASGLCTRGRPYAAREHAGEHQDPENARQTRHEC
jgi:hypothetical protein